MIPRNTQAVPSGTEYLPSPSPEAVRRQLERILTRSPFSQSERLRRFLRFTVEETLNEHGARLKEYVVGVEVFDRRPEYDPRIDPIVRVEARRLRAKLKEYYDSKQPDDELLIEFPKGSYCPTFGALTKEVAPSAQKSIVVLPFSNATREPDDDYLSDGLTEELIHRLTRVSGLRIVAWQSAAQLRGRESDLTGIRSQLGVDLVLKGSVRRAFERVRVTAQLIDTATGGYLWSETYDREMQDILCMQDEIARAIIVTLQLTLDPPRVAPAVISPKDTESLEMYLRGRFHWNRRTPECMLRSIEWFERSAAINPGCALPYAGLADAWSMLAVYGVIPSHEAMPKARSAALRALELDPRSAEAHTSLGVIRGQFEWNWSEAEALYRRAIAISPNYANAYHWLAGDVHALHGRFDQAEEGLRIALRLDPLSLVVHAAIVGTEVLRRRWDVAEQLCTALLDLDSSYFRARSLLGRIYIQQGRYDEAIAELSYARTVAPGVPNVISALTQAYAFAGREYEALRCLADLKAMAASAYVPSTCFAVAYIGLGEFEEAIRSLERACELREASLISVGQHAVYDPLRGRPELQQIVKKMNFRG